MDEKDAYITAFLVLSLIYLLYIMYDLTLDRYAVDNLVNIKSNVNGEFYRVHAAHKDKKEAAKMLSLIDQRLMDLLREMKRRHPNSPITTRLLHNYNPDKIAESTPYNMFKYTSYTINKGEMIRYCIRNKDKNAHLLDYGHMMFVAIHEFAHVGAVGYGHDDDFWATFKALLKVAQQAGIYDPIDYSNAPFEYCGMKVTYNPYYDQTLANYL